MPGATGGLLLVHAHPDDESIGTGATMAAYAASGVPVTLVTCTLGELGEVIPPGLAHLATDGGLGDYRRAELAAACAALGVSDQRFLGGPGRWRDSGMAGLPSNDDPRCFWRAALPQAAAELAAVIRETRPRVLVTYDENGFYGHPDHIQAHRVSRLAITLAAGPAASEPGEPATGPPEDGLPGDPWQVARCFVTAMPRSVAAEVGGRWWVPDEQVTTCVDGSAFLPAKIAALRAHATQISVDGDYFALSDGVPQRLDGHEYYTLLPGHGAAVPADDLFAGL